MYISFRQQLMYNQDADRGGKCYSKSVLEQHDADKVGRKHNSRGVREGDEKIGPKPFGGRIATDH